jgi:hypothetical protein
MAWCRAVIAANWQVCVVLPGDVPQPVPLFTVIRPRVADKLGLAIDRYSKYPWYLFQWLP